MENHTNEQLSALMDGELRGPMLQQALERLRHDAELQGRWRRYHLISDSLHANLSSTRAMDLHLRVHAALEQEPTLLAPRRRRLPQVAKQAAGLAIAASVAAVAILAIQQDEVPEGGYSPVPLAQTALPASSPASSMVQLASSGSPGPVVVAAEAAARGRLQAYLVNHNEYAVSAGMQGVLPYVRIVSNEKVK